MTPRFNLHREMRDAGRRVAIAAGSVLIMASIFFVIFWLLS